MPPNSAPPRSLCDPCVFADDPGEADPAAMHALYAKLGDDLCECECHEDHRRQVDNPKATDAQSRNAIAGAIRASDYVAWFRRDPVRELSFQAARRRFKRAALLLVLVAFITGCASDAVLRDDDFTGTTGKVVLAIFDANIYRGFGLSPGLHLSVRSAFATSSLTGMAAADRAKEIYIHFSPSKQGGVSRPQAVSNDPESGRPNTVSISVISYDERDRLYSRTSINDFPSAERIQLLTSHPCRDLTYTGFVNANQGFALGTIRATNHRSPGPPCIDPASIPHEK